MIFVCFNSYWRLKLFYVVENVAVENITRRGIFRLVEIRVRDQSVCVSCQVLANNFNPGEINSKPN